MRTGDLLTALHLPEATEVGRRVAKTQLLDHGAWTAADRRAINEGIERLTWVAALKPDTVGIAPVRNVTREYVEIHVLHLALREEKRRARLVELVHRAVPYPVVLATDPATTGSKVAAHLSLAHKRWSQAESGRTVLDGEPVGVGWTEQPDPHEAAFVEALAIERQVATDMYALYQSWIDVALACLAARRTGRFNVRRSAEGDSARREALRTCEQLDEEITRLRSAAKGEKQMPRLVELNLAIQRAEAERAAALTTL